MSSPADKGSDEKVRRKRRPPAVKPAPPDLRYRVEGLRRGRVLYVNVVGRPGAWRIYGPDYLKIEVKADSIDEVLRKARRQLPFRPIAVRLLPDEPESIGTA